MRTLDIAVFDDDISTLELISSSIAAAFGKKGVATQMDTFFSAGSLRRRMETRKYDLLFLDIQMPMENGIELGSWLRAGGPGAYCLCVQPGGKSVRRTADTALWLCPEREISQGNCDSGGSVPGADSPKKRA